MTSDEKPAPRSNPFQVLREKLGDRLPPGPAEITPAPRSRTPSAPPVSQARITVRQERAGRGGKTVTLADGPGLAGSQLEELAREAAKALGVGARAEKGALVLQGDQRERLAAWLAARGFGGVVRGN
jgi:translation initiation factor 1